MRCLTDQGCLMGCIAGELVREKYWQLSLNSFKNKVQEFNKSKKQVSHPGRVIIFLYCPDCGSKIE